jgi:hypothetical protein
MTTYTNPFTGQTINPSQVGYELINLSANTVLEWPINGNNAITAANIIDVLPSTGSGVLKLALPPASQVSIGQQLIIRNIGSSSFEVTNDDFSTVIATIASGVAEFIFLTDNTTVDGVWAAITFGAGTSAADAAALAGYGLTAQNTVLNQTYSLDTIASSYTILATGQASFYVWIGGAGTLTLPSAESLVPGWFCMIRNNGSGIVTVTPQGTDTIDGNSTQQLQLTESLVLVSNGTGFNTFGYGRSSSFQYTQLVVSITSTSTVLTSAQAANTVQTYTGTLSANSSVTLPSTVQIYAIHNGTTGAYSLSFKTASSGYVTSTISQGVTNILVCDGLNVYNASGGVGSISSLLLSNGSAGSPSLAFASDSSTGLYLVGSGQLGFSAGGSNGMTLTTGGLLVPVGIQGGTF